ncbi:hypothetical protein AAC387_Pa01g0197 [Persea americana]
MEFRSRSFCSCRFLIFSSLQDTDIIVTYTDALGDIQTSTIKAKYLSDSWVWEDPDDENHKQIKKNEEQIMNGLEGHDESSTDEHRVVEELAQDQQNRQISPVKLMRRKTRKTRREKQTSELIQGNTKAGNPMQTAAIEHSQQFNSSVRGKYSIWRREYNNPYSDSTLRLMQDQIIMAKVHGSIALSKEEDELHDSLMKEVKGNQRVLGEANSDAELKPGALEQAKAMGHILSVAKDKLFDCTVLARKLRAMLVTAEESVKNLKKQSTILIQLAAKSLPKQFR